MTSRREDVLYLFDVDGTLTPPRKAISPDMRALVSALRKRVTVAVVGGSDFNKQLEQLGKNVLHDYDFTFSENGLRSFKGTELIHQQDLRTFLGEERIRQFINYTLRYIADLDIPIKRGTFVEFRTGMINVSPIGRNCNQEERDEFNRYDDIHKIRADMVENFKARFSDFGMRFSIGGQISFDVFPIGWDKTYCLRHIESLHFKEIHFFGDKTSEGGNDHEIYVDPRVIGHKVTGPEDTMRQGEELKELFPGLVGAE